MPALEVNRLAVYQHAIEIEQNRIVSHSLQDRTVKLLRLSLLQAAADGLSKREPYTETRLKRVK